MMVCFNLIIDDIELSDESGNIKCLREAPNKYANEILDDRETLILLRVERKFDDQNLYVIGDSYNIWFY